MPFITVALRHGTLLALLPNSYLTSDKREIKKGNRSSNNPKRYLAHATVPVDPGKACTGWA